MDLIKRTDYESQLLSEYMQLDVKVDELGNLLDKYLDGTEEMPSIHMYNLLHTQLVGMSMYLASLKERLILEGITLPGEQDILNIN